jgi:hypothetical protein
MHEAPTQRVRKGTVRNLNKHLPAILYPVLLLLAVLIFFFDAIFTRQRTLIWDAADFFYPYLAFVSQTYRTGTIPLWNPFLSDGYPSFANMQSQTFYPVNLLFTLFGSFTAYRVHMQIILHCFLAGLFMYFLGRNYFKSRLTALFVSLVYMLSGFFIGHFEHISMIDVTAWLPLIILLIENAIKQENLFYGALAGLALGVSILAGHPQSSHMILVILIVHGGYRVLSSVIRSEKRQFPYKKLFAIGICLLVGLLISGIQVVPTYELVKHSVRGQAFSYETYAKAGVFTFRDLVLFLIPNYFGSLKTTREDPYWGSVDISEDIIYIGIVPFTMIFLSFFHEKKREVLYCFLLVLFCYLVTLGGAGGVYRFLFNFIPGFDYFKAPVNLAFGFTFFAALSAGFGFEKFCDDRKDKMILVPVFFTFVLAGISYFAGPAPPSSLGNKAVENISAGYLHFMIFSSLFFVLTIASVSLLPFKEGISALLVLLSFLDVYTSMKGAITLGDKASPNSYEAGYFAPAPKQASEKDPGSGLDIRINEEDLNKGLYRIASMPPDTLTIWPVGFNRAILHKIFLVDGYEPLFLKRLQNLESGLLGKNVDNFLKINNARYVLVRDPSSNAVQLNPYPPGLPRAYIVGKARIVNDDERVLELLGTSSFNPSAEVILSESSKTGIPARRVEDHELSDADRSAVILEYGSNRVKIKTYSKMDSYLVFSDTYYPGWRGWVDDTEYPVWRANFNFKAIYLPRGEHIAKFQFAPDSFLIGALMTAGGVALVILTGLFVLLRNRGGSANLFEIPCDSGRTYN